MVQASWKGTVLAESDETKLVEGNHYFPPEDVVFEHLEESDHRTTCGWKGEARYYHAVVGEDRNENAAWHYPDAKPEASQIEGYVAFWNGVRVEDGRDDVG